MLRRLSDGDGEADPQDFDKWRESMSGPLGVVGDSLIWERWKPIVLAGGIYVLLLMDAFNTSMAWYVLPLCLVLLYNIPLFGLRWWALDRGFEKGKGVVLAVNKWDLIKGNTRKRSSLDNEMERQLKFISFAPRVNFSALTGERVMKVFDKIDMVHEQFSQRFNTSFINKAVQKVIDKHPPPRIGRGRLKFLYATQIRTRPPTFMLFVNRPDMVHFSYERFLINQLRENLRLEFAPVKIMFKKK